MNIEKSINISDNLRVWMLAGKMKQAELAEYLGMAPGMMSQRLMGVKEWRDEDVERISKLMNVSEEKLMQPSALGETLRRFEKSRKNPSYRKNFGGRLNRLAGKKGETIRELSAKLGMDYSGICKWVMGTGLPSAFALVKIANYFGMTAAQLAGFEPEAAEAEPEAAEAERSTVEAAAASAAAAATSAATSAVAELSSRAREIAEKARGERLTAARAESVVPALAGIIAGMNESSGDQAETLTAALTALHRFIPQRVRHSRKGACCPVCGAEADPACKICEDCGQRLSWELGCGDEVFMRADPECRFWICGKKENGFLYGFDMSFELHEEHPDDLEPTGRRCPELARGLEAAARAEMQEVEKNV